MMRLALAMAWVNALLPVFAAGREIPEFKHFDIVITRNVFDATRRPPREEAKQPPPTPPARPRAPVRNARHVTLAGVFLADDRAVALLVEANGRCSNIPVGGEFENLTVTAVNSSGARLRSGETELTVAVGDRLSDGGEDKWTVVGGTQTSQAPSVQEVKTERKAASRAELLRQMMERRKRELQQ